MNSIRESCRSIEELDLGGNKLTDLIEVYKILQCTPNLKFLNLSENDLSRSSPVAMAATCSSPSSTITASASTPTTTSYLLSTNSIAAAAPAAAINASPSSSSVTSNQNWSGSNHSTTTSMALSSGANSRAYLAPLNQNNQQQAAAIGARRHSTLGQPSSSSSAGNSDQRKSIRYPATSRVAEARRLAAANAVAQSKKTSSSVASKLTHSASANASLSHHLRHQSSHHHHHHHHHTHTSTCSSRTCSTNEPGRDDKTGSRLSISSRHQVATASTMHLARSLSSLSAKDVRAASSSLSRLTSHRSSSRKVDSNLGTKQVGATDRTTTGTGRVNRGSSSSSSVATSQDLSSSGNKSITANSSPSPQSSSSSSSSPSPSRSNKGKVASGGKLFVEPIVESDDVDMNEQQVSLQALNSGSNVTTNSSASASTPATTTTTATNQQLSSSKTLATQQQTGINSTVVASSPTSSRATNQFGGSAFSITGIHQTTNTTTATNQSSPNYRRTFESIKALALNNTGCQWRVVCSILSRMPNLEELHLSLNNYERIDLDINEFKHNSLKRLYLCNNPKLTNWEELDKLLIAFPSLEALSIADCNISQIPDNLDRAREWQKLCGLNINGWPIKEWPIIERLNQLPSLIDLKCRNLEILSTIDEPRHHLIARLPKLQRLNGSEIEEREHAEKAFLRFFMANSHLERPSRFHELVQIHGEIIPVDVDVDLSPPSQAHVRVVYLNRNYYRKENEDDILMSEDFLIKLMDNVEPQQQQQNSVVQQNSLENMEVGEPNTNTNNTTTTNTAETEGDNKLVRLFKDEGQEVLAIEVDLRQSVRKFKSTLANLFNLDSQNLILYYIDHEMVGLMGPELIKHNQKKLWNYNVQDGDQFIVEER